jgi:hypothetical protein
MQTTSSAGGGGASATYSVFTPDIYEVERHQLQIIENGLSKRSNQLADYSIGVALGSAPKTFVVFFVLFTADIVAQPLEDLVTFTFCMAALLICAASLTVSKTTKTASQRVVDNIRRQPHRVSQVGVAGGGGSALATTP